MSIGKKSRFEGLPIRNNPPKAQATPSPEADEAREALSTQIRPDLKAALKHASTAEGRKVYQVLEDALEEYLKRNHSNFLK